MTLALTALLAGPVHAAPNKRAEAAKLLDQFLAGEVGINQVVNRVTFLGEQAFASAELVDQLKRTGEPKRRGQMLDALASFGVADEDVEKVFIRALTSDDVSHVISAVRGLGKIKSKKAVQPLVDLLSSKVLGVRREAARALGELRQAKAGAALVKAAKTEDDLETRAIMLVSTGRSGDAKQTAALEAFLSESSESARLAAAQALCILGQPKGVKYAEKLLESKDRFERVQGVLLFEGAPAKAASVVLTKALQDSDDKVRANAARVLYQGGDATKLDWLVVESAKAQGETRLVYETEIEKLRLTDEQRAAILKKVGLK